MDVVCLVRSVDPTEAPQRVLRALAATGIDYSACRGRITILPADIAARNCGLSDCAFAALARTASRVYHCAASVNLLLPYVAIRRANAGGTAELLRLAMSGRQTSFHLVSSLVVLNGVTAAGSNGPFVLPAHLRAKRGYAKSKAVAERLAVRASSRGLSVSIYRPGLITGHNATGFSNLKDRLSLVLMACMKLRVAPAVFDDIYLTPVDAVSRAILQMSTDESAYGRAHHLVGDGRVSWTTVLETLQADGYIENVVPYSEWLHQLSQCAVRTRSGGLAALAAILRPERSDATGGRLSELLQQGALNLGGTVLSPAEPVGYLKRIFRFLAVHAEAISC